MRIEIVFQQRAVAEIAEWVLLEPGLRDDRIRYAKLYLTDIKDELEEHEGLPIWVFPVRVDGLPMYDWHYSNDVWIRYSIRDRKQWFRRTRRIVTIWRFSSLPLVRRDS